mmetsp:Transcript_22855/g.40142  ORF Transcript_22855/g.40142 Transcript_22855/m.40142 type:complete len:1311 (-) Transcript_22855:196-4128(-)
MDMAQEEEVADGGGVVAVVSLADEDENDETTIATTDATAIFSHNDLFAAVEESILSCQPVVDFFYHPNNQIENAKNAANTMTIRQRRDAICDTVKSPKFKKARARLLFSGLIPLLKKVVEEKSYIPTDNDEDDEDDEDDVRKDNNTLQKLGLMVELTPSILFVRCCAFLVEAYLDGILAKQQTSRRSSQQPPQKIDIIDEIFPVAEILHDLLFPLQSCLTAVKIKKEAMATQSAIFSMCEKWWHGNFEHRNQMVIALVPLLLVKSFEDTAQKNDIKRLCSIQEALDSLDFEDEGILMVKMFLLRTIGDRLFLQSVEGRKFITHLFLLDDASLVMDLHRAVKAEIVMGENKDILNAYAEIYYNAWKASTDIKEDDDDNNEGMGTIQTSIEENALQDFMFQVIHAANPSTAKSVRTVLDKFYLHKKSPHVEAMLHRMFGPLLWRALSASNSRIRQQASVVLVDTFPLGGWAEVCVKRSVKALMSLMGDDVPDVRVAGSRAAAKILSLFWVAVPSADIRTLLNQIIVKHASDASSSAVRAAAVTTITTLLQEEKTHAVLRPLLPSIGNLIHDKTEKVRLAVVNMLLSIKKIRGMKYYHVVPANHLLARLAEEGRGRNNPRGNVAASLSNLLSNSFFPTGSKKAMTDIINRTLRLLTDSPGAAVTFYKNAYSQLSVNSISRLIAALMKCLCFFVVEEKKKNCEDASNISLLLPEGEAIEYKGSGLSSTAMMATIAESVSILWESIEAQLKDSQNENAKQMLMEEFSGNVLTEVYCHFETKFENDNLEDSKLVDCLRACIAILNCAGKVDESKISGLRAHIIGELSNKSDMPAERRIANLSPNVALLCAWGMTEDVARYLASSISRIFAGDTDERVNGSFTLNVLGSSRKSLPRSVKKKVAADEAVPLPNLDIDVCLGILGHILKGSYPASALARESILKSETAFNTIVSALQTAKRAAEQMIKPRIGEDADMSPTMIRHIGISIECYGRLLIHKEAMKGEIPMKLTPEAKSLMNWVTNTIVPALAKLASQDNDFSRFISYVCPISSAIAGKNRISSPIVGNPGDTSFVSGRGSLNSFEDTSKFVSPRAAAITVMSSVLCTVAEWSLLRYVGDSFVSDQISKWCKLLECSDTSVRKALLPWLFHIAITSLENEGDSALLEEVLLSMKNADPSKAEVEIIVYAVATVMSLRDERILKAAISTIVNVTRIIIVQASEIDALFLDKAGSCMRNVIESVLSEEKGSVILAQCLIDEHKASSVRECLLKELHLHSPKTDALDEILSKWVAENTTNDTAAPVDDDKENKSDNQNDSEPIAA